jgi:hypothetical protein
MPRRLAMRTVSSMGTPGGIFGRGKMATVRAVNTKLAPFISILLYLI